MKIRCGTDIIEISRIRKSIDELGETFKNKVFTQKEIEYCESKGKQKYQHYAARFAAKEAAFKAISKMLDDKYELCWKDYEVLNDENGRPSININSTKIQIEDVDLSLSHCKEYATAVVVVIVERT